MIIFLLGRPKFPGFSYVLNVNNMKKHNKEVKYQMLLLWEIVQYLYPLPLSTLFHSLEQQFSADFMAPTFIGIYYRL